MLKHTAGSITPSITKSFNLSLCIGCVPIVSVPNPKSTNNKDLPNKYRPIFLKEVTGKTIMQILVVEHLSINHPLSNSQWGFFEGQPTATALLSPHYYS